MGLLDHPPPDTLAAAVMRGDRLIAEYYGPDSGPDTPLLSWSMAKSITQALVGILVRQGRLDVHAPADVPEWADPADPRHAITLDQLLRMSSGLRFVEDYVDAGVSDVIEMLFGSGQHDVGAFAASFPLDHPPDQVWNYSSGTTNIISRAIGGLVDMRSFMQTELFDPLAMTSASAGFDAAGTFVGSSYVYATAVDFLRFGRLYLRDDPRVLPAGWIDYARAPTPGSDGTYGAHWWVGEGDTFYAQGYEGQYLYVVPSLDLLVVRLGKTPAEGRPAVEDWIAGVIDSVS
ncbi:MAG: serine hydrolase domain-containing protein [Acidimicrobiales bacterium]